MLNLRNLSPIIDDEYGGGMGFINLTYAKGCNLNDGTDGFITVDIQSVSAGISWVDISVYLGGIAEENKVDFYSINLAQETSHRFNGLADAIYTVQVLASDGETMRTTTQEISCIAVSLPPNDDPNDTYILLQAKYVGPRIETVDGVDKWAWTCNTERFNTITEKQFAQRFTVYTTIGQTKSDFLNIKDPVYAYCVPQTTTRHEFNYSGWDGHVTKKVVTNSTICGFVAVRGCTDPTATNYNPNATEDDGTCYYRPTVYGCTDPRATNYDPAATDNNGSCIYTAPTVEAIFHVPLVNSLRFVATENIDGIGTHQTLDNVLFCSERHRDIRNVGYFQKVCKSDVHTYQWLSNYSTSTVQVISYRTGEVINAFPATVAAQNTGDSAFFQGYLQNNTNGQTRVYFNTGDIPAPAGVGDVITVANNLDFAGVYAIVDIKQDVKLQSPYLVINRPYTVGDSVSPADIQFNLAVADYDVMQVIVDWNTMPEGTYQVLISGSDSTHGSVTYTSEPVEVRVTHPDTLLITYRNYDNAFDCVYTTGILHQMRVEGELRERLGGGMDEIHREPMNKLTRLRGVAQRRVRWTTWNLPAWLHEKLSVVTRHDYITINGVEYQTEEGYGEPEYNKSYAYCNASTIMEQVEWFKAHNDHDLGSINQQPLLIVNGGFLRL